MLNGKASQYSIKKETESLVIETAKKLGYVPNKIARGLRLKKTDTVALLTPDLANPFFAEITKVIQNELRKLGYNLLIFESSDDTHTEIKEMKLLKSNGIDGMLIIPVGDECNHIEELSFTNYPLVVLYRTFRKINANAITVNHYLNIHSVVSSLIKNGHTKIGMLQGKDIRFANSERLRGYKDALKENNILFKKEYVLKAGFEREHGYSGTNKLLNLILPPTALIVNSDALTLSALQVIKEHGLIIPDDIVLIATNILQLDKSLYVPISSISHPVDELGKIAVKILIDEINMGGKKEKEQIVLKSLLELNEAGLINKEFVHK